MAWDVLYDEEFSDWLNAQDDDVQNAILAYDEVLGELGPTLGRPRVEHVKGSEFKNMKELRIQIAGDPWRVLLRSTRSAPRSS